MNNLDLAKTTLLENDYSIVVVKEDKVVNTSNKNGLMPILDLYNDDKSLLNGASVADKVIGLFWSHYYTNGCQERLKTVNF